MRIGRVCDQQGMQFDRIDCLGLRLLSVNLPREVDRAEWLEMYLVPLGG